MQLHLKAACGYGRVLSGKRAGMFERIGAKQENPPHLRTPDKRPCKNQFARFRKLPDMRHVPALQLRCLLCGYLLIRACLQKCHHIQPHPVQIGPELFSKCSIE